MGGARICVLTDSVWVSAKLQREAAAAVKASPGIVTGDCVGGIGRLRAHAYDMTEGQCAEGLLRACESMGSSHWSERSFMVVYVRRERFGVKGGRLFTDGALRAQDADGGDQAWKAFEVMCSRVGVDCARVFGVGIGRVAA